MCVCTSVCACVRARACVSHQVRGAKDVVISLDNTRIFKGVIDQAPGNLQHAPAHAEMLVFAQVSLHALSSSRHDKETIKS